MYIPPQQREELLCKHGVYATSACDHCGKVLGAVSFTRKDDPGEWCSRACRNGVEITYGNCIGCGVSLAGGRKRRLYCGDACRKRPRRQNNRNRANSASLDYPTIPPLFEQEGGQMA